MSLEALDQLRRDIDTHGFTIAPMPIGLNPAQRAAWLLEVCRSLDLLTAERADVMVGALPGPEFGGPYTLCDLVFVASLPDTGEQEIREALS